MLLYPRYVAHLESTLARGAIIPSDMPNLRGALTILFPGVSDIFLVLVISLGLLLFAAWKCRNGGNKNLFDREFSLAAVTTVLVSYHAMIYDLSLLMVPVLLLANELLANGKFREYRSVLIWSVMAIFFFAPLQLVLSMRDHRSAVMGWVLLLWLRGIAGEISFRTPSTAPI